MQSRTKKKTTPYDGQLNLFDALLAIVPQVASINKESNPETVVKLVSHFFVPDRESLTPKGELTNLKNNLKAIRLAYDNLTNNTATQAQRDILSRFSGWGSAPRVWDTTAWQAVQDSQNLGQPLSSDFLEWANTFGVYRTELEKLLSPQACQQAQASILTAYYTPPVVIDAMWQAVSRFGFKGGRILEPGAGIGHFIGLMPQAIRQNSQITAVECEETSGRILSLLYPEVDLRLSPFEQVEFSSEELRTGFDLIIGNVPFGGHSVYDPNHRDISKLPIHNYFIAKSTRLLNEGGILAILTTSGTFDSVGVTFREWLVDQHMGLVGAIRLPGNAFTTTQVTTDILFFQKGKAQQRPFADHLYQRVLAVHSETDTEASTDELTITRQICINEYYCHRQTMVVGNMRFADEVGQGGAYRADRQTCFLPKNTPFEETLYRAFKELPTDIYNGISVFGVPTELTSEQPAKVVKIKGRSYTQKQIISQYVDLKRSLSELWQAERDETVPEWNVDGLRVELARNYRLFTRQFGLLNRNRSLQFLEEIDPQFASVQALENRHISENGKTQLVPSDILRKRVYQHNSPPLLAGNLADAAAISSAYLGRFDIDYIAQLVKLSNDEVVQQLRSTGLVFIDPITEKLIPRKNYLSGQVRKKLAQAQQAARINPAFQANVDALETIQPDYVPVNLIAFELGSVWLPLDAINGFITAQLGFPNPQVTYNQRAKCYESPIFYTHSSQNQAQGTPRRLATELIESALNHKSLELFKTIYVEGKEVQVRDIEATTAAVQAQERLQELFVDYVRSLHGPQVEALFNDLYTGDVAPIDEPLAISHFPGASPDLTLRVHQKKGVSRILRQDVCLAHSVGTGKTFQIITGVMELNRLGMAKKALISVQNSTLADFANAFRSLYPAALLCVPEPRDLKAKNRRAFLHRIRTNSYDAVIIPQSFLKRIPDDPASIQAYI